MQSKKLRLSITCIVVLGIMSFILQYNAYVVSRVEQQVVDLEIAAIKRFLKATTYLDNNALLTNVKWQDKPTQSWLSQVLSAPDVPLITDLTQLHKGEWGIWVTYNQLVYRIQESQYFKSQNGDPFIFISLHSSRGKFIPEVSTFQWCKDRAFWGCKQW